MPRSARASSWTRTWNLDGETVVSCDKIVSIPVDALDRQIGALVPRQEPELTEAIHLAFDLD